VTAAHAALERRLGVADATVIGVGSMLGAGVFVVWSPAAATAGTALLGGLLIAAVVAVCNASSSAQLAAVYPRSGGTYVYARHELGEVWGFGAGAAFVVGKIASCAAGALGIGAYLWPQHQRIIAVAAVVGITAVNLGGLTRTVRVTVGILVVSISTLALVVISSAATPSRWSRGALASESFVDAIGSTGLGDLLGAAGLLFFAFAGYARIATLGEEVIDPNRTIMRAIPAALAIVVAIYSLVGVSVLGALAMDSLVAAPAPLRLVVEQGPIARFAPAISIGAALAALGVLLNLVPGISRTMLAMARERDLPPWLSLVSTRRALPVRAELTTAVIVIVVIVTTDLRGAIATSGVAVLWYYALTNAAAIKLDPQRRRWPRSIAIIGLLGCVLVAFSLDARSIATAAAAIVLGLIGRSFLRPRTTG